MNSKYIASFDIDAQKTFSPLCPNELPVPEGHLIVAELNAQAKLAHYRIGSKDAHSPQAIWVADEQYPQLSPIEGLNVDVCWNEHAVPGTLGFELLDGLPAVTDYDFFVWKGIEPDMHPYGACYHDFAEKLSTGAIEFLKQKNVSTIIAGGLATDYCVKLTVLQLLRAKFKVMVNLAACRGISDTTVAQALTQMRAAGAMLYTNAKAIADFLSG
jgi:nicotinamidase/pyrazinamidase